MPLPRLFETEQDLLNKFQEYWTWVKDNPIVKIEQKKGNTILPKGLSLEDFKMYSNPLIEIPIKRPLTIEGFENFVGKDLSHYFANTKGMYDDLQDACKSIKRIVRQDQIEGGLVGIYNPQITSRLQGLVEQTSTQLTVDQPLFPEEDKIKQIEAGEKGILE